MTHTNEEFFNPQFYSVHEENDFNYNLVPHLYEEVCFNTKLKQTEKIQKKMSTNFKDTCNVREVSLLGKAYPNCQYFNDQPPREESQQLVQDMGQLSYKIDLQNNNLPKLQPRMGTLVRFSYNNS